MSKYITVVGDFHKSKALINKLQPFFTVIFVDISNTFNDKTSVQFISHNGDAEMTAERIRSISPNISYIIPGSEGGVELCDLLNMQFNLHWNDAVKAAARRDKFKMQRALKNSGLKHINGFISSSLSETLQRVNQEFSYPVVIKPIKSALSDNVYICHKETDLIEKFNLIIDSVDIFDNHNTHVLVQEFINGIEYVVDTVSIDKTSVTCAVWRYNKIISENGNISYRSMELEEPDSFASTILIPYASAVLDAVGIENGASHQEIMLINEQAVLVEVGARIHGGSGGYIGAEATKYSITDVLSDSLMGRAIFDEYMMNKQRFSTNGRTVKEVFLISNKSGVVKASFLNQELQKLTSFFSIKKPIEQGGFIEKTINLQTSPTSILLVGSKEQVGLDEEKILQMERNNQLYLLE
jgi:phosphoribosylamine-glycine ligase